MKDSFKKLVILIAGIASSIGTYAISGAGIAAATLGSAAAVTILGVGISKRKHKNGSKDQEKKERKEKKQIKQKHKKTDKKELRKKITDKKKELKEHKNELRKLKHHGKASTPQAKQHTTIIQDLEVEIDTLKKDLERL